MKVISKIAAAALMAVSFLATAEEPRKEAVLDTGKGGLHIVVSVPNFAQGPYDFSKQNPGPKNNKFQGGAYSEVMYNAPVGDSAVVVYQVNAFSRFDDRKGDQRITPDVLATDLLKSSGFTMDRAVKIDSPEVGIKGASVVTYKVSGNARFGDIVRKDNEVAMIVTAVALPGQTQGYTISAMLVEKDVPKFDADPAKYERGATRMFNDMYKNTVATKN